MLEAIKAILLDFHQSRLETGTPRRGKAMAPLAKVAPVVAKHAAPEILEDVISDEALAVAGMHRGRGTADQDGAWQDGLEVPLGGQKPLPLREVVLSSQWILPPETGNIAIRVTWGARPRALARPALPPGKAGA